MRFLTSLSLLLSGTFTMVCAQNDTAKQYLFNSTLTNGYKLVYKYDDSLQYLYLNKGKTLKLLSTEDIYNKQSLLGFVPADFDEYFVLVHTLHVTNIYDPIMFELVEKKLGLSILKGNYIDAENNMLLYYDNNDTMKLYNIRKRTMKTFEMPVKDTATNWLINKIRIKNITPAYLTVTFYKDKDAADADRLSTKIYKR